jgi:tRNA(fMet)-specific endonuclease VapC
MKRFLDTDTCIYAMKGLYPSIPRTLAALAPSEVCLPSIVKAELLWGAARSQSPKTLPALQAFLFPLAVIPFCDACTEAYARIRHNLEKAGTVIGPNDLIIAATVLANDGVLVTHNTAEFKRVRGLQIEDWVK